VAEPDPSALQSCSNPSEVEDLGCVSRFTQITGRNCVVVRRHDALPISASMWRRAC